MKAVTHTRCAIVAGLALIISGCGVFKERRPPPTCPPIFILKDVGKLKRYKSGTARDVTDVLFLARMTDFRGVCDYNSKRTEVEIDLKIALEIRRGPANIDRKVSFEYFVAIPQFHPKPQGKKILKIGEKFSERSAILRKNDQLSLAIPLSPKKPIDTYSIYLGFHLSKEELRENRLATKF